MNTDNNDIPQPPPGPGYWQASDGNWYPPESHPQAGPIAGPPPKKKRRGRGLLIAVLAVLGGCTALVAVAGTADDEDDGTTTATEAAVAEVTTTTAEASDDDTSDTTEAAAEATATTAVEGETFELNCPDGETYNIFVDVYTEEEAFEIFCTVPSTTVAAEGEASDVLACVPIEGDQFSSFVQIDLVNQSSGMSDYFLELVLLDADGVQIDDDFAVISAVLPGESISERVFLLSSEDPAACEVISVDRSATSHDESEATDVEACNITGVDFAGDVEAEVQLTNPSSEPSNYDITVAFLDADGNRVGTAWTFVQSVATGRTAVDAIITTIDADGVAECQVRAVQRTAA